VTIVVPGMPDTYLITVTNNGPSPVSSVTLTDPIPPGLLLASFTPSTGAYDLTSGLWSGLSLASGQSVTMTLTGTIDPTATGTIANIVTVAPPAGVPDTDPTNDSFTDTDTLTPEADLSVTKTDGVPSVVPGTVDTYTITVTNNGPSTVNPVFTPSVGTYDQTSGEWSGLSLASGQSVTMTLTGTIDPTATDPLTNTVTVAPPAGVTDPIPGNDTASDTDTLTPAAPSIQVVKFVQGQDADTPTGPHVVVGGTVVFGYRVTNTGNVPLANVVVTDDKLGTIAGPAAGDTNGDNLLDLTETWIYGATTTAVAGQQTNTGTVTAQDPITSLMVSDVNPANYFGDAPRIQIVKFVNGQDADDMTSGSHVAAGSTVTFTYEVTDTGNVPLANVVVIDNQLGPSPASPVTSTATGCST
jgi:uncharacterized repeat protein (TIGR01451 family)